MVKVILVPWGEVEQNPSSSSQETARKVSQCNTVICIIVSELVWGQLAPRFQKTIFSSICITHMQMVTPERKQKLFYLQWFHRQRWTTEKHPLCLEQKGNILPAEGMSMALPTNATSFPVREAKISSSTSDISLYRRYALFTIHSYY